MIAVNKPLFKLGQVVATPGAIEALERAKQTVWSLLSRHMAGNGATCRKTTDNSTTRR